MSQRIDLELIRQAKVVAILRASDTQHFPATVEQLVACGVQLMEFSMTTPGAGAALAQIKRDLPAHVRLGLGTVTTTDRVKEAADAGADFLVTPTYSAAVLAEARKCELPVLGGALSPTEINATWVDGALAVKVFPASTFGPAYCKAVLEPLPEIALVPTGGVNADNARSYLDHGAVALGVARSLLGDSTEGGSLAQLAVRAHQLLEAVS